MSEHLHINAAKNKDCIELQKLMKLRKYVSKLYTAVLTKNMTVREALVKFPKDSDDGTITAAWHALCHLEADEDIRKKDKMYADAQDEYIEHTAYILSAGQALPDNIIDSYTDWHESDLIPHADTFKGFINSMKKFLC